MLKFKISVLETEISCKNAEIDKLNKKLVTNINTDNRADKSNTVNTRLRSKITYGGRITGSANDAPTGGVFPVPAATHRCEN